MSAPKLTKRVQKQEGARATATAAPATTPLTAPASIRQSLQRHITRPVAVQRQVVQAPLRAAQLERQETERLALHRHAVTEQLAALPSMSAAPAQPVASPAVDRPQNPTDWVTVMRQRAAEIEGQPLDARQHAQFTALQRQTAQALAQGFRTDRSPATARYEHYGDQLASLQRHPVSAPVAQVVLGLVPGRERLALQRAVDTAVQRHEVRDHQAAAFAQAQTLQRQLAELDAEATQPVL
ncbi:hypothetical protein [Deinococcus arboris]|uniref:hypothetical protein n=1 Tax=Deinococcus arboris TaxID=2682977 RepID=UPI001E5A7B5B|nr:hypothetical protein [Deinococcus arboris]